MHDRVFGGAAAVEHDLDQVVGRHVAQQLQSRPGGSSRFLINHRRRVSAEAEGPVETVDAVHVFDRPRSSDDVIARRCSSERARVRRPPGETEDRARAFTPTQRHGTIGYNTGRFFAETDGMHRHKAYIFANAQCAPQQQQILTDEGLRHDVRFQGEWDRLRQPTYMGYTGLVYFIKKHTIRQTMSESSPGCNYDAGRRGPRLRCRLLSLGASCSSSPTGHRGKTSFDDNNINNINHIVIHPSDRFSAACP